jgi:hypothetical protein
MKPIALQLIFQEFRAGDSSDSEGRAAFRVCEKLRGPLSRLTGVAGFRSLLSRALSLAKAKVPWLGKLQVRLDGSFEFTAETEAFLGKKEAADGGLALIAQVLELLGTFIGEALTLRLVKDIWPKAALKNL